MAHGPTAPLRPHRLSTWVDDLQARGRYTFTRDEALAAREQSDPALTQALGRLAKRGRIISPRQGFYVIVPQEYRLAGGPPAAWFIDSLMAFIGQPYYVGLLSAAGLHGAAHQQPQVFQVMTGAPLRPAKVGRVRIQFTKKSGLERTPILDTKTPMGTMKVSTPEATALDLVRFPGTSGGLDNVATVLTELAEVLDRSRLVEVVEATGVEVAVVQRLGYLLDLVEQPDLSEPLARWGADRKPRLVSLRPGRPTSGASRADRWRLLIDEAVEPDL